MSPVHAQARTTPRTRAGIRNSTDTLADLPDERYRRCRFVAIDLATRVGVHAPPCASKRGQQRGLPEPPGESRAHEDHQAAHGRWQPVHRPLHHQEAWANGTPQVRRALQGVAHRAPPVPTAILRPAAWSNASTAESVKCAIRPASLQRLSWRPRCRTM